MQVHHSQMQAEVAENQSVSSSDEEAGTKKTVSQIFLDRLKSELSMCM